MTDLLFTADSTGTVTNQWTITAFDAGSTTPVTNNNIPSVSRSIVAKMDAAWGGAWSQYKWHASYDDDCSCKVSPGRTIPVIEDLLTVPKGERLKIALPDGTKIDIDAQGNFRIDDKEAKVVYQANRQREFNPYLNASDLLARFVEYVGTLGVRRSQVGQLPVLLFINWLVVEAATRDQDPLPEDVVPVPQHPLLQTRLRPRCLLVTCRRFVRRRLAEAGASFCSADHAQRHFLLAAGGV